MTARKVRAGGGDGPMRTPAQREAEASVALDGQTQSYDPAAQAAGVADPVETVEKAIDLKEAAVAAVAGDDLPEEATPVYTYAERYSLAVEYLRDVTNGDFREERDELLAVFPRGEFTAFVFKRTVVEVDVPEFDEETEAMPRANTLPEVILQTSAKFRSDGRWGHGTGPRTALLVYGD